MNKAAIKNFAVNARITLIEAVRQRAFEYEITEHGVNDTGLESVSVHPLSADEREQRKQLIHRIRSNGFAQTMEEAAYTWFNRLIALRFMEVNGYLPSRIRVFTDENGAFKPEILSEALRVEMDGLNRDYVLELLEAQDNDTLYKYLLITQCNALNKGLPEMFEEIGGWTELLFPDHLLRSDSVIAHMVEDIPESDWTEQVQIIGWMYQYYNTESKDMVFRGLKKNGKVSAAHIPAATQLFTPDWIVCYMVDNSLGRLWLERHPDSSIREHLAYYLDAAEPDRIREPILPEQIRVIDPCMGSGHILVYAFDLLMQIYTSCGWSERDAAKSILTNNLYGLDIDRRAYQLAYFAVMMKARQYHRRILNEEITLHLANFQDTSGMSEIYGSLMKPEDIADADTEPMQSICRILSQQYDVVVTNPPYLSGAHMNTALSDFVKKQYPDSSSDLFACFMERGLELAKPDGYSSMVTMQSWMFLSSYETMRKKLLYRHTLTNLMHMENMVMGIAFGTAVSVFRKGHIKGYKGTYHHIRLNDIEKVTIDGKELERPVSFPVAGNRFAQIAAEQFSEISGSPVAYWVSERIFRIYHRSKSIADIAMPKQGFATTDNERFLRLWFEIAVPEFADHLTLTQADASGYKWFPYNKGGAFRKWYGNYDYVCNWENAGRELKQHPKALLRNMDFQFRKSITWSLTNSSYFGARARHTGSLFDTNGMSLFSGEALYYYLLAFLCCHISTELMKITNPTLASQVGDIARLPLIEDADRKPVIDRLAQENVALSKQDWDSFETSWDFRKHPLV